MNNQIVSGFNLENKLKLYVSVCEYSCILVFLEQERIYRFALNLAYLFLEIRKRIQGG